MTSLMTSCKEGNLNIANMLIHSNSYVNLQDKNGDTSLIHACKAGHLQVVEALLKAHAAVDHQGDVSNNDLLFDTIDDNYFAFSIYYRLSLFIS